MSKNEKRIKELEELQTKLYMALKDTLEKLKKHEPQTVFVFAELTLKEVEGSQS